MFELAIEVYFKVYFGLIHCTFLSLDQPNLYTFFGTPGVFKLFMEEHLKEIIAID